MPLIRVHNLRLGLDDDPSLLTGLVAERLGLTADSIGQDVRIARRSVDARHSHRIQWVYSVDVAVDDVSDVRPELFAPLSQSDPLSDVVPGEESLPGRPVIIGCGPAGIFAAYTLARFGYSPLVIERGAAVRDRVRDVRLFWKGGAHNPESNLLFGEGGAGTFSDGKLTCRTSSPLIPFILQQMVEHRAPEEILYETRPHIGTDRLRAVLVTMRKKMEQMGVEFQFNTRLDDIVVREGVLKGIQAGAEFVSGGPVFLGIGHSARDTYEMLLSRGVEMEFKPFQFGLRVEHPQELVDRNQYGAAMGHPKLGTSEYIMVREKGKKKRPVFSFCMCPGGVMLPSISENGMLCTNGMSNHKRDSGFADSGFVTTIGNLETQGDDPLRGLRLQRQFEKHAYKLAGRTYAAPAQSMNDFLRGNCSGRKFTSTYPRGLVEKDLREIMPAAVGRAMVGAFKEFGKRMDGFTSDAGIVTGPESRGSSPVRICRNEETRESTTVGMLYPIGEGAGFAGGIISAAVDGMNSALAMISRFAPPK